MTLTTYDIDGITVLGTDSIVTAGAVNSPSQTYRVTVNSFMANCGDGFSVFNFATNRLGGAQDIDTTGIVCALFPLTWLA